MPPENESTPMNQPEARTEAGEIKNQIPQTETTTTPTETETPKAETEAKPGETKPEDKKPEAPQGAPEKYEPFTLPEGFQADDKFMEAAQARFKELGLTQEAAQGLVDMYTERARADAEAPFNAYKAQRETWRSEIVSDPTIGDGKDNLKPEVRATLAKAIDSLGEESARAFREALDFTGIGDNPAFIRGLYALAQGRVEGGHVRGNGPATQANARPSAAQALYPKNPSA